MAGKPKRTAKKSTAKRKTAKPTLLAGGNPQIPKADGARGMSLHPLPPVGSKHQNTRYFHIHEDDQLDEELVASWIKQASELPGDPSSSCAALLREAVAYNTRHSVPKSKGSRATPREYRKSERDAWLDTPSAAPYTADDKLTVRGDLPRIAATLNKVLKSDLPAALPSPGVFASQ